MNIFRISNGKLLHIQKETINTGSKGFFKLKFIFDETWVNYTVLRFAEFHQTDETINIKVEIPEDGIIDIPTDFLKCTFPICVAVSAENENGTVEANTNFVPLETVYGANTNKETTIFPEEYNNLFNVFSASSGLRYFRISDGILEYSSDNITWYPVNNANVESLQKEFLDFKTEVYNKLSQLESKLNTKT